MASDYSSFVGDIWSNYTLIISFLRNINQSDKTRAKSQIDPGIETAFSFTLSRAGPKNMIFQTKTQ
jgi:hypothetical protein